MMRTKNSRRRARDKLRIAQVAPLSVRVPPSRYGGTERVVFELTEELVRRGHAVTLFAAGTSATSASLWPGSPKPLWELESFEGLAYEIAQVEDVVSNMEQFDVIHWHTDYMHWLVLGTDEVTPSVTTLHGRLDSPAMRQLFGRHSNQPLISISEAQRRPLAGLGLNWIGTIHHGLRLADMYHLGRGDGGYLSFVGRSSPEKGIETAIRVAIRVGLPIKVAAMVGPAHRAYHQEHIVPLLDHPLVEWLGEVTDAEKASLLEGAMALLMPIDWDEPFGLSFIEALAAGTPVITRPKGALPELMKHGLDGFFAETEDELVRACTNLPSIDRATCRARALERFSVERMTDGYELAYRKLSWKAELRMDMAQVGSSSELGLEPDSLVD